MKAESYSKEEIGQIIADGAFHENTAVICFHDPAVKRLDSVLSGSCRVS